MDHEGVGALRHFIIYMGPFYFDLTSAAVKLNSRWGYCVDE